MIYKIIIIKSNLVFMLKLVMLLMNYVKINII